MSIFSQQNTVNDMTVAVGQEMSLRGIRHPKSDTIFMASSLIAKSDEGCLATLATAKNYKLVVPVFDRDNQDAGPVEFVVVATDGLHKAIVLRNGRLWKRDRRNPAILVFTDSRMIIKLSGKGLLIAEPMVGIYHDQGYDIAREGVLTRAGRAPGATPIISSIGSLIIVLDAKVLNHMAALAA